MADAMNVGLTPTEYEHLVRGLISNLTHACEELGIGQVDGGRTNLIPGKSSFMHQIDVSVSLPNDLLLIECKFWKDPVGADAVLTLAGRALDIREAECSRNVSASIVSTQRATAGAELLAIHFGISLDVATDFNEYVVTMVKRHFVGKSERFLVTDSCAAEVTRRADNR